MNTQESQRNIILIGGAPTVGKSTMARLLAKRLDIPWMSTDQIREIMRTTARREDVPKLFTSVGYAAEDFLTRFSAEEIARMEMDQGEVVWIGIKEIVKNDYTWKNGFIIEGVDILPHLVARDFGKNKNIKAVFLIDEDADRTRHVVFTRGLWDDARAYADDVKEKEIEWSLLFGHQIKVEAEKYNYPWIEATKDDDAVETVLKALAL